jgi:serine protease
VLGPAGHGNGLFFSALIPVGLIAALYGVRRLRAPLAGLALGVGAHLLFHAVVRTTDIQWIPNAGMADELWLVANAAICAFVASVAIRK